MKIKLFDFFDQAVRLGASDATIKPGAPPAYRINGHFWVSEEEALAPQEMFDLFLPILDTEAQATLRDRSQVFLLFPYRRKARIRVALFRQREGLAASFRFLPLKVPTIKDLRLPDELENQALKPRGLFLVTGPAGSGKSHTMAAMINAINRRFARHIISMESPIEFLHTRIQSIFTQIEVGKKIRTYQDALMNALREDPDVIMIGEMKDEKTVEMAMVASETGHMVLSTLPTLGASKSIERIVSFFPSEKHDEVRTQISMNLVGIFSQLLIPQENMENPPDLAYEMLIVTSGIRTLIREKKYSQLNSAMLMARREGCITLKDSLSRLLKEENVNVNLVKALLGEIQE
jgi:twitching motility protein PilT